MTANIPIHVAIPSYNNAEGLRVLLPKLQEQNFASITVLNDGSTDDTAAYVQSLGDVQYIQSETNGGTVAAKNLILQQCPRDGYILFIDSDIEPITTDIPERLTMFFEKHKNVGAGVGRILDESGKTMRWNYGYDINPWRALCAFITYHPARLFSRIPIVGKLTRLSTLPFTAHMHRDIPHKIDWAIESFFFVKADIFLSLNGFSAHFKRFHEGPDICLRIRKHGCQIWYNPDVLAKNHDQHSGTSWHRAYHWWRSLFIYFYKHPSRLLIYIFPRP